MWAPWKVWVCLDLWEAKETHGRVMNWLWRTKGEGQIVGRRGRVIVWWKWIVKRNGRCAEKNNSINLQNYKIYDITKYTWVANCICCRLNTISNWMNYFTGWNQRHDIHSIKYNAQLTTYAVGHPQPPICLTQETSFFSVRLVWR